MERLLDNQDNQVRLFESRVALATSLLAIAGGAATSVAQGAEVHSPVPAPIKQTSEANQLYKVLNYDLSKAGGLALLSSIDGGNIKFSPVEKTPKAHVATGTLNNVGPALSPDNLQATHQLDYLLGLEGPNSPLGQELGQAFGINTVPGRTEYVTPQNISLGKLKMVTNKQYPSNNGSNGETVVPIANLHPTSEAFPILATHVSSDSRSFSKEILSLNKFESISAVLRTFCENLLKKFGQPPVPTHQIVSPTLNIDVSYGIKAQASAWAKAISKSSSHATVTCPDGTKVTAGSSAKAQAIAKTVANLKSSGQFFIKGNFNFSQVKTKFNSMLNIFEKAATKTSSSTSLVVNCAPSKVATGPTGTTGTTGATGSTGTTGNTVPTVSFSPTILFENMPSEGGFVGDSPMQFCAEATSNPTTDGVKVTFTDANNNTLSNTFADPNGDPNSYCVLETPPTAPQPADQLFATAADQVNGKITSATSEPFPWRMSSGY